jgi:hypothetical protein
VWQVKPPFSLDAGWKPTGCARVANTPADATWSLLDERDPTKGLMLTMLGGQECHSTKTNRTFTSEHWPRQLKRSQSQSPSAAHFS